MKTTYYYDHVLNKDQRKTYFALKEGLLALDQTIVVPGLPVKELSSIYSMIRMDCPEIFYTNTFKYRIYEGSPNIEVIPVYMFEKKKILEHRSAMDSRVRKLARQAEKLDDMGKVLFVHDFICQNVTYDKLKKAYSHEIIGALGNSVAVCEGISKGFKILMDALGVWCTIAICGNNPGKGIKYRHAWNVVKINGKYYNVDATFDNSVGSADNIRYDYMCLADDQISRDHEPLLWKLPPCTDKSCSYYRVKKLSFTKLEDVHKRSAQAAKKGRILTFHWRGGYLTKEVFAGILEEIRAGAAERDKVASVSVNWPQAVICARFTDAGSEAFSEDVIMQEANEGELYDVEN